MKFKYSLAYDNPTTANTSTANMNISNVKTM